MGQLTQLDVLAQRLEEWVWHVPAQELAWREPDFRAECKRCKIPMEQILARQADEALVRAVQKGFCLHEAFEELLPKRYEHRLQYWFGKFGTEPNQALDLAQQIYLKLYRTRLQGFEPTGSFVGFLYRTARNLWISKVARARRLLPPEGLAGVASADSTEENVIARELEEHFQAALDELSPEERSVLELSLQGLAAAAVAERLDTTKGRVYRLLFQARPKVAKRLAVTLPPERRGRPRGPARPAADPSLDQPGDPGYLA